MSVIFAKFLAFYAKTPKRPNRRSANVVNFEAFLEALRKIYRCNPPPPSGRWDWVYGSSRSSEFSFMSRTCNDVLYVFVVFFSDLSLTLGFFYFPCQFCLFLVNLALSCFRFLRLVSLLIFLSFDPLVRIPGWSLLGGICWSIIFLWVSEIVPHDINVACVWYFVFL